MSATRVLPRLMSMFSSLSAVDAIEKLAEPPITIGSSDKRVDEHELVVEVANMGVEAGQLLFEPAIEPRAGEVRADGEQVRLVETQLADFLLFLLARFSRALWVPRPFP